MTITIKVQLTKFIDLISSTHVPVISRVAKTLNLRTKTISLNAKPKTL